MSLLIYLPEFVCLAGALIYALAPAGYVKTTEVGRIMFAFGLLATLLRGVRHP